MDRFFRKKQRSENHNRKYTKRPMAKPRWNRRHKREEIEAEEDRKRKQQENASGWLSFQQAVDTAPFASGIYQIGFHRKELSFVETIYIGHTTSHSTLREHVVSVLYGFDTCPSDRLAMFLLTKGNRKSVLVQWSYSVCPEELIEDRIEEHIATHHMIPEFNVPVDPRKGTWVLSDKDD